MLCYGHDMAITLLTKARVNCTKPAQDQARQNSGIDGGIGSPGSTSY